MTNHSDIDSTTLRILVRRGVLRLAGNRKLKIYGKLGCKSGKRMKKENRVFFVSEDQAIAAGYRACKVCKP